MQKWFFATLFAGFLTINASAFGALKTADVPTFKLRARIAITPLEQPEKVPPRHTFRLGKEWKFADDGEWTDWMEFWLPEAKEALKHYPNIYMHAFPVVTDLVVDRASDPTKVEVELQFDENKQTVAMHAELFGPRLGILVWRDADKKPMAGTMADYNRTTYWKVIDSVAIPAERRPKKFLIIDRFIGGDDDRLDWREGLNALSRGGFTAITIPPSLPVHALFKEAGLKLTAGGAYSPPGGTFSDPAFDGNKEIESLDAWSQKEARKYTDVGFSTHDVAWFALADEPGWYFPSIHQLLDKPETLERFRAYLRDQGLKPGDLGAAGWENVKPIARSGARDLAGKKLFYWSTRFYPWDSSRYFALATRAMEKAFYPGIPLATNFNFFAGRFYVPGPTGNNKDKLSPDAAMGGHDWLEFGRMRGCTMLWTEDWFGDGGAPQWSFYCAKLRCAAEKGGVNFGGYVVPRAAGDRDEGIMQKMLCIAGSGGKAINTYVFGPEYNFPGNCYSQRPQLLAKLAEANGMIGAAEDLLLPGRRPRPQAAILSPRSAEPWDQKDEPLPHGLYDATNVNLNGATVDYLAESADLYFALQHADIPADFVEEEDLSPAGLSAYRVLYVTEPNIPEEAQRGLVEWVKAGGTLVTVSGAGACDRYDERCKILADFAGANEQARPRLMILKTSDLQDAGAVKSSAGSAMAIGARGMLTKPEGEIRAVFDDGSPAIVSRAVGKGHLSHFAFLPGLSYIRSAKEKKDGMVVGFSPLLRDWICTPAHESGVTPPVTTETPLVETPVLLSEHGAAVTVLNWTGEPIANVTLHIRLPFEVKTVNAVRAGILKFHKSGDEVIVNLPVNGADIVMLRR